MMQSAPRGLGLPSCLTLPRFRKRGPPACFGGGPTTWLHTTRATMHAEKSGPHAKCGATACARPRVTPAWVRRVIQ
eukprot:scaffold2078_cov34-Tisochrysis_lutea.AAC.5